ncbi:DEAD/DEAH box helicase [Siccirubricoccus deserti]|uniref:DEAD-box ATP-dependent RNA helicase RhpA n=1 Tax=Siccirubricoccus deserti TaxID=2013562 RepID=A0A9X0R229_9PROT|nr:DEAD/DEAH box helicase [Siccirubricoccus deserti]MBC4018321.1 DEAD/DEAH box helicase [Siccirubricoccus deserti]GGC54982.1 DEAD/DEAH box helicase [Siccirubricoccus deserti]
MTLFNELGLAAPLLRALDEAGYTAPTPIQAKAIPVVLEGRDLLGIAQTGTGKTAAFALPILHRLQAKGGRPPRGGCRVLVLSPTRELASQIAESFRTYGTYLGLNVAVVFGGVPHGPQRRALSAGVDIVVATPGRLQDHLDAGTARLDKVEVLVLDEADQMLDQGFLPAIRRLVKAVPRDRQTLFFSATMPTEIGRLAGEMLQEPARVEVAPVATTAERVAQRVLHVEQGRKRILLAELLRGEGVGRTLVFTRTKHGADRVVKQLEQDGLAANAIHGNKSQGQRERALAEFKAGTAPVMVATDIAARGIDVDGVTHVVQYDLPEVPETYVHRIGRTARAGASGEAVALVCADDLEKLWAIEKLIRQKVPDADMREDKSGSLTKAPPSAPRQQRGGGGYGRGRGGPGGGGSRHGQGQGARPPQQGQRPAQHGQRQGEGGGEGRRRAPAAEAPRRDRSWREGDFRDTAPAATRGR